MSSCTYGTSFSFILHPQPDKSFLCQFTELIAPQLHIRILQLLNTFYTKYNNFTSIIMYKCSNIFNAQTHNCQQFLSFTLVLQLNKKCLCYHFLLLLNCHNIYFYIQMGHQTIKTLCFYKKCYISTLLLLIRELNEYQFKHLISTCNFHA